jgi:hypothetical protein
MVPQLGCSRNVGLLIERVDRVLVRGAAARRVETQSVPGINPVVDARSADIVTVNSSDKQGRAFAGAMGAAHMKSGIQALVVNHFRHAERHYRSSAPAIQVNNAQPLAAGSIQKFAQRYGVARPYDLRLQKGNGTAFC